MINKMEHNEPLNLSIKKKPIAVVIPSSSSSSNKGDANTNDANERASDSPLANSTIENDEVDRSTPAPISEEANTCNSDTILTKRPNKAPAKQITDTMNEADESSDSSIHNLNLANLLYGNSTTMTTLTNTSRSPSVSGLSSYGQSIGSTIHQKTQGSASTTSSASAAAVAVAAVATVTAAATALNASIVDATNSLANYLNQQKSLDIAKMHLERYLKVTNQYLHATLDGSNLTSNEQVNHLIRTNILTNKIAANNLISIINKLLEQNMISEYYFKHASRLMTQQTFDNNDLVAVSNVGQTAQTSQTSIAASNIVGTAVTTARVLTPSTTGFGSDTNDKDLYDSFESIKAKASPIPATLQQSELLKELIKQRDIRYSRSSSQHDICDDDCDASDSETNNKQMELLDYDDTIKKETIPVHVNPFMSYLHMHLNRNLDKSKSDSKYFNGITVPIPNSLSPNDSQSMSPALISTVTEQQQHQHHTKPSKSNKKRSNATNNLSNNNNNNNCNINKNTQTKHSKSLTTQQRNQLPYDLTLNLSQRASLDQQKNSPNSMHIQANQQLNHHHQQQHHPHHQQSQSQHTQSQHHQQSTHQSHQQQEQINEKKKPHIKKPLNAFMLYMKEMRAKVVAECTLKESAAINQILGRRWHSLSREEQSKYYEKARQERQLHMELYPGWSARDNYGYVSKKKKRKKDRSPADSGGNNMKKCRARFGLDQQNQWCKPCRRKKKCIRYMEGDNDERTNDGDDIRGGNISDDNLGSCGSVDDVKTPPEDDIESLNHSLSSPGAFSGLSYLQSPSTNLASSLRIHSVTNHLNQITNGIVENHTNSSNDNNNNTNSNSNHSNNNSQAHSHSSIQYDQPRTQQRIF